jgi:folate-dependent tRNA-U54 methylase TrmFO/GidA
MAEKKIDKNDQAANRTDGNSPGVWPGSGTTVEGPVESATSGILAGSKAAAETGKHSDGRPAGSASTSADQQEPEDLRTGS